MWENVDGSGLHLSSIGGPASNDGACPKAGPTPQTQTGLSPTGHLTIKIKLSARAGIRHAYNYNYKCTIAMTKKYFYMHLLCFISCAWTSRVPELGKLLAAY